MRAAGSPYRRHPLDKRRRDRRTVESRDRRRARIACFEFHLQAGVAQLVEQLIRNQQVSGSSPLAGSNVFNELQGSSAAVAG